MENRSTYFNIDLFKAGLEQKGVLKPSKFLVQINPPAGISSLDYNFATDSARDISFWCTATSIPGIQLNTYDVRRYGYGMESKKPFSASVLPVRMNILLDGKSQNWLFFRSWIKTIFNFEMEQGINYAGIQLSTGQMQPYELSYVQDYVVGMRISQFNDAGDEVISVVLRDAYPAAITNIEIDWNQQNQLIYFNAVIVYTDWWIDRTEIQKQFTT